MARATISVVVADLPKVQALVRSLEHERDDLRHLVQQFEQRVVCPQCGQRYSEAACGPSHATVMGLIRGHSGRSNGEADRG